MILCELFPHVTQVLISKVLFISKFKGSFYSLVSIYRFTYMLFWFWFEFLKKLTIFQSLIFLIFGKLLKTTLMKPKCVNNEKKVKKKNLHLFLYSGMKIASVCSCMFLFSKNYIIAIFAQFYIIQFQITWYSKQNLHSTKICSIGTTK